MAVQAITKNVRMSSRKVGVVAALVRGRSVADAITILENTPRRSATPVMKTIQSAKANAEHNHNYKADTLRITEISVTNGPSLKRYRPAAHGRALPFQRRSSRIHVTVDGEQRVAKKPVRQAQGEPVAKKVETNETSTKLSQKEAK